MYAYLCVYNTYTSMQFWTVLHCTVEIWLDLRSSSTQYYHKFFLNVILVAGLIVHWSECFIICLTVLLWWYFSVAKGCLTLCDPMDCIPPGSSVLRYLPEFAHIHIHLVSDANHLILYCPLLFFPSIFPSIRKWQPTSVFLPQEPHEQHFPTGRQIFTYHQRCFSPS